MSENGGCVGAGRKALAGKGNRETKGVIDRRVPAAKESGAVSNLEISDAHYRSIQLPCDAFEEEVSDKPGN